MVGDYGFEMMTIRPVEGRPVVERLRTLHKDASGQGHSFPLSMESSGTQRLMGLLPMLFDIVNPDGPRGEKVYVVDTALKRYMPNYDKRLSPKIINASQLRTALANAEEKRRTCRDVLPSPGVTDVHKLVGILLAPARE